MEAKRPSLPISLSRPSIHPSIAGLRSIPNRATHPRRRSRSRTRTAPPIDPVADPRSSPPANRRPPCPPHRSARARTAPSCRSPQSATVPPPVAVISSLDVRCFARPATTARAPRGRVEGPSLPPSSTSRLPVAARGYGWPALGWYIFFCFA